jgi:hypothetical protein
MGSQHIWGGGVIDAPNYKKIIVRTIGYEQTFSI